MDAAPAARARHGRLGALQARSAGRPCARRRGAGHQCRAVGDHRAAGRGVFQRLERKPSGATGPCSWSATSSRRSTASRAPIRASSGRRARRSSDALPRSAAATTCSAIRRDAGVPRPVDRRQLPLGPAGARRRRRGDRRRSAPQRMALARSAAAASRASSATAPACVELWEPFAVEESPDDSDEGEERWVALRDRHYAEELAERVRAMIEEAPVLPSTERPLTPGDILILVRSRGELASLIVARLFSAGRAGRRRRPAAPARAARGAGSARGGEVRGRSRTTTSTSPACWSRR